MSRAVRRLALKGNFTRLSTRARPGFEIDARSQRQEKLFGGEVTIRTFSRTHFGAKGWRREVEFDQAAVFREANLGEELNRRNSGAAFILRIDLTPLTSVLLEMGRERDRYVSTPLRDADSTHVAGTVTFQPLALISGDASFGYRRFLPLSNEVPPYRGGTAVVNLTYAIFGTTRLGVGATRNIQPSFELSQPYFLETGVSGSVQQQIYGGFDILARTGLRWLEYRDRLGARVQVSNRTDRVRNFGLGAGYRLGLDKRIGFNVDYDERTSGVDDYRYNGLRYGMSITYET